jgi:hypothetical protein
MIRLDRIAGLQRSARAQVQSAVPFEQ